MLFYGTTTVANVIWPAMYVGGAIMSTLPLAIISIVIEGLFLHRYLENISYKKALYISFIGNIFSTLTGIIAAPLALLMWHALFDSLLGGTFNIINKIVTVFFMYLASCLIELYAIRGIFGYTIRQLLVPIAIGNLVTYIFAIVYMFLYNLV